MNQKKILRDVLRVMPGECMAVVGAGGKTSAMFQIASQFPRSVISTTTHLLGDQGTLADRHEILQSEDPIPTSILTDGITLITGMLDEQKFRFLPPTMRQLEQIAALCTAEKIPFFIEADGARHRSIKAPGSHEPDIPVFADSVLLVAGLSVFGKPLNEEVVHRPEIFSQLGSIQLGDPITAQSFIEILLHPKGGLKNIPAKATRQLLLTQPESTGAVKIGKEIADRVIGDWDRVVIGSLRPNPGEVLYTREWVSGVVLAAGSSTRYGKPKIHENFRGKSFLNNVCETAKLALDEVVVVTKPNDRKALSAAMDLGLKFVINQHPEAGQSGSIRLGIDQINPKASGVIFLHADQPQTSPLLLRALRDHALEFVTEIVAPLIDGQRGNPVYFDRSTFRELAELEGDQGGRQIFHRHRLSYVDWLDRKQLIDVDTPAQLRELLDE